VSKLNEALKLAFERGYKVSYDGGFYSPRGDELKPQVKCTGYYYWTISKHSRSKGRNYSFFIHRLQAYQKFGDKMFETGIQVRHINGNSKDNSWYNIEIGSISENMMDKSPEVRKIIAKKAAKVLRKLSDDDVLSIRFAYRNRMMTLTKLAEYYNVSKSTISYIVNNRTYKF